MARRRRTSQRRTSRKNRNVYLGKRVRDTGRPGLDNLREVRGITREIIRDYKQHRISYRTAMSRMTFLETTVIKRDSKLEGKKREAYEIVEKAKARLMRMRR